MHDRPPVAVRTGLKRTRFVAAASTGSARRHLVTVLNMAWMIYGANGYSGALLARSAARRGERPVLAGRTSSSVAPLAASLGLSYRIGDPRSVSLDGIDTVAN